MKRAILAPAPLAAAALDELKDWLAITTVRDDGLLTQQLRAALDMCEAFTGTMPLAAPCEEICAASGGWHKLQTSPVQAITAVEGITHGGTRVAMPSTDYALELDADGTASIRIIRSNTAARIAVRFSAGLAADWPGLPESLRQGVLRLAAHQYRQRDSADLNPSPTGSGSGAVAAMATDAAGMIDARTTGGAAIDHRLVEKARGLATAIAESRLLARRVDPARWRKARLLWPLFAKD